MLYMSVSVYIPVLWPQYCSLNDDNFLSPTCSVAILEVSAASTLKFMSFWNVTLCNGYFNTPDVSDERGAFKNYVIIMCPLHNASLHVVLPSTCFISENTE